MKQNNIKTFSAMIFRSRVVLWHDFDSLPNHKDSLLQCHCGGTKEEHVNSESTVHKYSAMKSRSPRLGTLKVINKTISF